MATKSHRHPRHTRRRSGARQFNGQWLVVLLARTLTTIIVMVVARLLGFTTYGGQ